MAKTSEKLYILDGNAILHRAWHALPALTAKDGRIVNAVYGFLLVLLKLLREEKPEYLAVTFDKAGPTFRDELYDAYKATRVKQPDELYAQIPILQGVLTAFGISIYELDGFEADDVIGTIADQVAKKKISTMIVTGDLDTLQLVGPNVRVYTFARGIKDAMIYDQAAVKERYGLSPKQIIDFKALRGDASDNIKGVRGIGEKGATEILQLFGSIEALYEAIKKNSSKLKKLREKVVTALREGEADAKLSKKLVTIRLDAPIDFRLEAARLKPIDREVILPLFQELGFHSLLDKLPSTSGESKMMRSHQITSPPIRTILSLVEAREYATKLRKQKEVAIRVWPRPKDLFDQSWIGSAVAWEDGTAFVPKEFISEMVVALEGKIIIGHDLKTDLHALHPHLNPLPSRERKLAPSLDGRGQGEGDLTDIMVASYLLNPGSRAHDLSALVFEHLGREIPGQMRQGSLLAPTVAQAAARASQEAADCLSLTKILGVALAERGQTKLFSEMEMPLIPVLAAMEQYGVKIDTGHLQQMSGQMRHKLSALSEKIYKLAGEEFNIASPAQLKKILFEKLKIPAKVRRTVGGELSTAHGELEKLRGAHPIIDLIFLHRELSKLLSTYVEALPELVRKETGRLHTTFNQTVTATGRLSSSEPNLQNIPIRTELGREIRKVFIAERGNVILAADYSQIELRLAAEIAKVKRMLVAFRENADIHTATAAEVWNLAPEAVTKEQRRAAKAINFGLLYGMGPTSLAESTGLSFAEAKEFIQRYFDVYPEIKTYMDETKALAATQGYVQTIFGRRRYLSEIRSGVGAVRAAAERMAINAPIQGCLPFETKVLTSRGYVPIGELDRLSKKDRPKFVWDGTDWRSYTVLDRGKAQLAEIVLKNGQVLRCDTRHIVLVATEKSYVWKKYEDLLPGDRICCSLPSVLSFETKDRVGFEYSPHVNNAVPFKIRALDEEFWYWIGYYYGDGWISSRTMRRPNCKPYQKISLGYVFGYKEEVSLLKCKAFFDRLGLNPRIHKNRPTTVNGHERFVLTVEARGLILLLEELGITFGATAKTKRFPQTIFSESLTHRKAFVRGFLDADGYYGRDASDVTTIHLCQRPLLEDAFLLLKTIGVPSKLRGPYKHKQAVSYRLDIPRSFVFEQIVGDTRTAAIRFGSRTPRFLIEAFLGRYPNLQKGSFLNASDHVEYHRWRAGGSCHLYFFYSFLKKYNFDIGMPIYDQYELIQKRSSDTVETTYTLSVDGSHRFDSEGVISKNTAADLMKLAMIRIHEWLAKEYGLGEDAPVKMLLQVHDELVFEVKKDLVSSVAKRIKDLMEDVHKLSVPIIVEVESGKNWGELQKLV